MIILKIILKKLYLLFFVRSNESKRKYLIKQGAKIGENTRILSKIGCLGTEPYLIEIGKNCLISSNVNFLTHDGGISVLNNLKYFEKKMDKLRRIKVGDNVFIGLGVKIMGGVNIGDNVIIGTGSIVTKDIESNSVVCGVPAKKIKTIEEYKKSVEEFLYPTVGMNFEQKRKYCENNYIK